MPDLRFPDHECVQRMLEHCVRTGTPLMLAHDDGVYLCCDGLNGPDGRLECAYARGCDPRSDSDWYETAHRLVGGDDFGERLDVKGATGLVEALRRGDRLVVRFNKRTISLFTERVVPPIPPTPAVRGHGHESPPSARNRRSSMSTKTTKRMKTKAPKKTDSKSGERLRQAAIKEIGERLAKSDDAAVHVGTVVRSDGTSVTVAIPGNDKPSAPPPAKATAIKSTPATAPKSAKAKAPEAAPTKAAKPPKQPKSKRVSALDAAATVLRESKDPMNTGDLIKVMAEKKLWTSPNGATPEQTLYAALVREIGAKGKASRFTKVERGLFASNPKVA